MSNKLSIYSLMIIFAILVLSLVAIIYRFDWSGSAVSVVDKFRVTTLTSNAVAGSHMAMKYSAVGDLQVHSVVVLELDFAFSKGKLLNLDFVDNEQYQFIDTPAEVYSTDDHGNLVIQLKLMPLTSGKIYIKCLASTTDGKQVRSFSIPLRIKDSNGLIPEINTVSKSRINLPVKGSY